MPPSLLTITLSRYGKQFLFYMWKSLMRALGIHNNVCSKLTHVNHFQSLILARVQRITHCTFSPIINSWTAELINSYRVIWTVISQLVLHNSGALLNHSVCQKNHSAKTCIVSCCCYCCWHELLCTYTCTRLWFSSRYPRQFHAKPRLILGSGLCCSLFNTYVSMNHQKEREKHSPI